VSHRAVSHWMDVLERLYFVFRIPAFSARRIRSLHKPQKAYPWDWSLVESAGARFESLVASHLLKLCHWLEDVEGHPARLHYLRDTDKREVDFLVTVKGKPWFAVEAKTSDEEPSPHLRYFGERLEIPFLYQVTLDGKRDVMRGGVRVVPAARLLAAVA
jgi:predicted AAA+ superfamily ATPase